MSAVMKPIPLALSMRPLTYESSTTGSRVRIQRREPPKMGTSVHEATMEKVVSEGHEEV